MKAILVVDIPDDYKEYGSGDWYVISDDDLRIVYEEDGALINFKYIDDDMAQLKPMPERINLLNIDTNNLLDLGYMHGRNDLINQIEGEEE